MVQFMFSSSFHIGLWRIFSPFILFSLFSSLNFNFWTSKAQPSCSYTQRITECLGWPWEVTWSAHPAQGHLEAVAEDSVQVAFEYLHRWDFITFLGKLQQCSVTPTAKQMFCFWMFRSLDRGDHCKDPDLMFFYTFPSNIYIHWWDPPKVNLSGLEKLASSWTRTHLD